MILPKTPKTAPKSLTQAARAALYKLQQGMSPTINPQSSARGNVGDSRSETPVDWMLDALCAQVGTEMFFPDKGGSSKDAKRICDACPVRQQCLEYALANAENYGIWGGMSERERRALRRGHAA